VSTIQLPGLLSGIDTAKLIAQLMAVESRTLNLYKERKTALEGKKDVIGTLKSNLETLKTSVEVLSDADKLRAFKVASSDTDILTAEASSDAFEGNHTVVINQLANAERWVHTNGKEYAEDYVGAGTFAYSYNHQETILTTTDTTTLQDLVGLINNDANNPGVTASLLYYNNMYHLVLNGNDAGMDYKIYINSSSTEAWESKDAFTTDNDQASLTTKIVDLDQFSGTLVNGEQIQITGTDHNGAPITQVNLNITANTRLEHLIAEINDAFDGIAKAVLKNGKIILTDNTSGTSNLSVTLTYNHGSGSSSLTLPDVVDDWSISQGGAATNLPGFTPADFALSQAAQDSKIKVDGYPATSPVAEVQHLSFTNQATGGTFTLTYDGQTTADINYNATIAEIQAALEVLPNVAPGDITVGGDGLTVNNGTTTFTFRNTAGDVNMLVIDSSDLTPSTPSNWVVTEHTKGQDGWISRSSNTVDNVISGITLHLHDTTDANGEQITLTRDVESVKEKLKSLVDAYNTIVSYIQENTGYDSAKKVAGVLIGDYVVSTIKSQLFTPLIAQTSGFVKDIDAFLMPAQIGLQLDRNGVLSLDSDAFDKAVAENYTGMLAIIGAAKTGSSDSNTIKFYGASSSYTAGGTYDVKVVVSGGAITYAGIKLHTESEYRTATFSGNIVTGNSSFDENGNPIYPENGLQLSVNLSQDSGVDPFTATVRVKQGFAGAVEDALDKMLKLTTGSIQLDQDYVTDSIEQLQDRIDTEEERLTEEQERLVARFARLERTLALIQQQMNALGFSVTA